MTCESILITRFVAFMRSTLSYSLSYGKGFSGVELPPPNVDVESRLRLRRGIPHRLGEVLQRSGSDDPHSFGRVHNASTQSGTSWNNAVLLAFPSYIKSTVYVCVQQGSVFGAVQSASDSAS